MGDFGPCVRFWKSGLAELCRRTSSSHPTQRATVLKSRSWESERPPPFGEPINSSGGLPPPPGLMGFPERRNHLDAPKQAWRTYFSMGSLAARDPSYSGPTISLVNTRLHGTSDSQDFFCEGFQAARFQPGCRCTC